MVVTNHVRADIAEERAFTACGGHVLAQAATTRLELFVRAGSLVKLGPICDWKFQERILRKFGSG